LWPIISPTIMPMVSMTNMAINIYFGRRDMGSTKNRKIVACLFALHDQK
jgi:hypothetical protein